MKKTYIQPLMKEIEMVEASFICSSISTGSGYKTEYNEYVGGFGSDGGETGKNGFGVWSGEID